MSDRVLLLTRVGATAILLAFALASPGFLSQASMVSLLTTSSFIGCVAVGMTLITLSGNVMAFCLGATAAVSAMMFIVATNWGGLAFAVPATLLFGALLNCVQGALIGQLRANPIIVSIAAFALIEGAAQGVTGGSSVYFSSSAYKVLKGKLLGIPYEFVAFLMSVAVAQFILSLTSFGRHIYLFGDSPRAAEAVGMPTWRTVTFVYFWAGLFAAVSGILLALRYGESSMEYGAGYDYSAIAAVLVGGTAVQGGQGAVWRTFLGVIVIAVVQMILLLNGMRQEWQYFIAGLIVLVVIMLQTRLSRA
jgi:ribose/xylose/arabinose/galactoside ABC-type transport system permease subunit